MKGSLTVTGPVQVRSGGAGLWLRLTRLVDVDLVLGEAGDGIGGPEGLALPHPQKPAGFHHQEADTVPGGSINRSWTFPMPLPSVSFPAYLQIFSSPDLMVSPISLSFNSVVPRSSSAGGVLLAASGEFVAFGGDARQQALP